ncbi:hypothetical protein ElyMa_002737000 [Elysia marginata]|uniref:Uncharacterized protein n=1 Tax=Elysia marginata TaxID=1093978 RepID=A0AAV4HIU4_9GAST|nr:hypothetical protein ElyMa_002737000 [Elysia marginata]
MEPWLGSTTQPLNHESAIKKCQERKTTSNLPPAIQGFKEFEYELTKLINKSQPSDDDGSRRNLVRVVMARHTA